MAAIYNQAHVPTLDKSLTFLVVDDFEAMLCYSLFQNLLKNVRETAPDSSKVSINLFDQSRLRKLAVSDADNTTVITVHLPKG